MNQSLITLLKDAQAQNLISKFSHFSDDDMSVFVHFTDPSVSKGYKVAKKLYDGYKLEVDYSGMFCELMERIIQENDDVSIPNLNRIMYKEVEKFNEIVLERSKENYKTEISKFEKFYNQYKNLNVFSTSIKSWDNLLIKPLDNLSNNKILRMDSELFNKVLDLQNQFNELSDGKEKAIQYEKLINKFLQHVKFDPSGVKKIRDLFIENLTFFQASQLPNPSAETVFKMLFERHKFDAEKFELRQFKDITEMLASLN